MTSGFHSDAFASPRLSQQQSPLPPAGRGVHVLGAGGHAKVVISTLRALGIEVTGLYDDDPTKQGSTSFASDACPMVAPASLSTSCNAQVA